MKSVKLKVALIANLIAVVCVGGKIKCNHRKIK